MRAHKAHRAQLSLDRRQGGAHQRPAPVGQHELHIVARRRHRQNLAYRHADDARAVTDIETDRPNLVLGVVPHMRHRPEDRQEQHVGQQVLAELEQELAAEIIVATHGGIGHLPDADEHQHVPDAVAILG